MEGCSLMNPFETAWIPPQHSVDAVARVLMGGGYPCEGSVDDAAKILRFLRQYPEHIDAGWEFEEGSYDAYGWVPRWMLDPDEVTHKRQRFVGPWVETEIE